MSGNLDKILKEMHSRTAKDIEKIEKENKEKHLSVMNRRPFI